MHIVIMTADMLYNITWMSRPLMQAAEAAVEHGLQGTGLTVRMRAVLEILHRHGAATVPEIAQRLEIKRQYVQLMVNDTLAEALTEQRPNPRHKRSPHLALTGKGQALIDRVIASEMALMSELAGDVSERDTEAALRIVQMMTEQLKGHAGAET